MEKKKKAKKTVEEQEYFSDEFTGKIVSHNKAKCGGLEVSLKKGLRYQSLSLGICKEDLTIQNAKGSLITLGWWPIEDFWDLLSRAKKDKIIKLLAEKYDLNYDLNYEIKK